MSVSIRSMEPPNKDHLELTDCQKGRCRHRYRIKSLASSENKYKNYLRQGLLYRHI
jgi:hypothetical protein